MRLPPNEPSAIPDQEPERQVHRRHNAGPLVWLLALSCALLLAADLFYEREAHFGFEGWIGFYAWYGFLMCTGAVLSARGLRRFLKRDEHFYD